MRLPSSSLLVMLLMLMAGAGLGVLIVNSASATGGAVDSRQVAATAVTESIEGSTEDTGRSVLFQGEGDRAPYIGVTFARQSADIVARSAGTLEAVYVNVGDRLKPGDVIARSESYSFAQQLQMAEATLRSMQAEERNAEVELADSQSRYTRRKLLAEDGLVSREDLEGARFQVAKAEAKLDAAQARVAEQMARIKDSEQSLHNTVVKAAFEGTVAARYVDSGSAVQSGTPIISLIRADDLWVRFAVPEAQHTLITIGSPINFQAGGGAEAIPGVIESLSPAVAVLSQEFLVEARLKVPAAALGQAKPGGSGLVSLPPRRQR